MKRLNRYAPEIMFVTGLTLLVIAAAQWSILLALSLAGFSCILIAWLLASSRRS